MVVYGEGVWALCCYGNKNIKLWTGDCKTLLLRNQYNPVVKLLFDASQIRAQEIKD